MRRRDVLGILGGAAVWPVVAARAEQSDRPRLIGMLQALASNDLEGKTRVDAFMQGMQERGWVVGQNLRVEIRTAAGDLERYRKSAEELIEHQPDLILATGGAALAAALQVTSTIPIVFVIVPDPVGAGYVESLSQPGGNATGFMQFEYSLSSKWPELLKEIAPYVTRAAVLRDTNVSAGVGQFAVIQSVAPSLGIELTAINMRDEGEIERSIASFARKAPNGGLLVTSSPSQALHRDAIIRNAVKYKLPAVYPFDYMVVGGGLIAYGPNLIDQYRRAADYSDRVLKGQKPTDLPVQAPTKYELSINLGTAKLIGLTVPPTLLARADKVIE